MLFKLLIPFTLGTVTGVRAMPVFDFPDFIHRDKFPRALLFTSTMPPLPLLGQLRLQSSSLVDH